MSKQTNEEDEKILDASETEDILDDILKTTDESTGEDVQTQEEYQQQEDEKLGREFLGDDYDSC